MAQLMHIHMQNKRSKMRYTDCPAALTMHEAKCCLSLPGSANQCSTVSVHTTLWCTALSQALTGTGCLPTEHAVLCPAAVRRAEQRADCCMSSNIAVSQARGVHATHTHQPSNIKWLQEVACCICDATAAHSTAAAFKLSCFRMCMINLLHSVWLSKP